MQTRPQQGTPNVTTEAHKKTPDFHSSASNKPGFVKEDSGAHGHPEIKCHLNLKKNVNIWQKCADN